MNVLIAKMSRKMLFLYTIAIFLHYQPILTGAAQSGDVTIGSGTVVSPSATISAENGPIVIGGGCVIEERVTIINRLPSHQTLTIGDGNVFKAGSHIEAAKIGGGNVFQSNCFVGNQVTVTSGCIIGAGCKVTQKMVLKEGTIIDGDNCQKFA